MSRLTASSWLITYRSVIVGVSCIPKVLVVKSIVLRSLYSLVSQNSAYMFWLLYKGNSGTKVAPHRPFEYFHHEREQGSCECRIPPALGVLIANESVLGLYL